MLVPITNRAGAIIAEAVVDEDDLAIVSGWRWTWSDGYAVRSAYRSECSTRTRSMHRAICDLWPGDPLEVDHLNHDKLDNRRINLRPGTKADNLRNRRSTAKIRAGQPEWLREHEARWIEITFDAPPRVPHLACI